MRREKRKLELKRGRERGKEREERKIKEKIRGWRTDKGENINERK